MSEIDWSKPIELMNGAPRKHEVREDSRLVWVSEILTAGFFVDCQGCIGGVQVVRNRKDPVKACRYVYFNPSSRPSAGQVTLVHPDPGGSTDDQYADCTKILVWRDETGKTRVEVCDD